AVKMISLLPESHAVATVAVVGMTGVAAVVFFTTVELTLITGKLEATLLTTALQTEVGIRSIVTVNALSAAPPAMVAGAMSIEPPNLLTRLVPLTASDGAFWVWTRTALEMPV